MEEDLPSIEQMEVNSDSSDDSSSDDEAEQETIKRAEELERQIADNNYFYDGHVELVKLYHQLGDLKSMRLAYERFHKTFPLTPEIWLTWINIEKTLASTENEKKQIFALFDKAVEDYLSVSLWIEYAQYSIGSSNIETTRSILERGLRAVGLHAAQGSLLWDTFRELELAHLALEKEGSDTYNTQVQRIVELFRRQLSVPLIGMESTYDEWKQFVDIIPSGTPIKSEPIEWGYKKAKKTLDVYKPFEDKLLNSSESDSYQIYLDYIKIVDDPSTIICIYERATTQMCLNPLIWLNYCRYSLKLADLAENVTQKALRNCSWSEELWVMRLRVLERLQKGPSELQNCFEQGIANLQQGQGLNLWLAYLDWSNRNCNNKEQLFKLFEQACDQFPWEHDPTSKIRRFYARTLARNGQILDARRIWKTILKNPQNKQLANVWLEYSNLERQYGEIAQVRSIFERALNSCTDWPQCIAEEFMMFEREHGTLQDILNCEEKCEKIPQQTVPVINAEENSKKRKFQSDNVTETKRVKISQENDNKPLRKVPIVKDPKVTVFISNLYPSINEKRLQKVFPNAVNIELVVDRQGKSRCYGYVQFSKEEEVLAALARDREELDGRPIFISNCKTDRTERKAAFKYSNDMEDNKLFVRGLPTEQSQEDVEKVFNPLGAISVRLVLHKSGQSKGLAYVEFPDAKMAEKALQKTNQMKIGEHTITVAISAPPGKAKNSEQKKPEPPTRHSKSRLQVPLVPRVVQKKTETNGGEIESNKPKSNADFRKMLLK